MGLMIALLLVDIGLAAAGGVLLSKGLAERETKEPAPVEKKSQAEKKSEAPAIGAPARVDSVAASLPAPAAAPTQPTTAAPTAPAPAAAREAPKHAASDPKLADKRPDSTKVVDTKSAKPGDAKRPESTKVVDPKASDPKRPESTKVVDAPAPTETKLTPDPAPTPNPQQEIDALAAGAKASFAQCAADYPAHGSIKIAFQVRPDGRVSNVAAVENATGNTDLARCLIVEISSWRVTAHNGAAINMLRPFTYP
jgi:hypothetical protein